MSFEMTKEDVAKYLADRPELIVDARNITDLPVTNATGQATAGKGRQSMENKSIGAGMSENALQKEVVEFLQGNGWRVLVTGKAMVRGGDNGKPKYITPYRADGKGFPDCLAVKGDRMIAFELKSEKGKPSIEQTEWLLALSIAGCSTGIIIPSNWENIKQQITGIV